MDPLRLLIVRHGESTWNAARRWQGRADPPLSDAGREQAAAAAVALASHGPFDSIVTSTLQRSRDTGRLLARHASLVLGAACSELAERSAGAWEGLTRAEIDARFPGHLSEGRRPDGYEHDPVVVARALAAFRTLAGTHRGRRLVVVSHGGVINALERHVSGVTGDAGWQRVEHLAGRWFEYDGTTLTVVGERVHLLTADDGIPTGPPADDQTV